MKNKVFNALRKAVGIEDTYIFVLNRVKSSAQLEDFEEIDEETLCEWTDIIVSELTEGTKFKLPKCVANRINWVSEVMEDDGLTPLGAIECIFATNEEKLKEDFEFGASGQWLEVTEEFKEWRDGGMSIFKQFMILHAFVNGYEVAE